MAPKKSIGKIPPQNVEAEQSLLGSVLIDKDAIFKIADIMLPSDFYMPAHERIFEGMLELFDKSQPIDVLSVTSRLREKNILEDIGGASYIADLTTQVPTAAHILNYAKIIR